MGICQHGAHFYLLFDCAQQQTQTQANATQPQPTRNRSTDHTLQSQPKVTAQRAQPAAQNSRMCGPAAPTTDPTHAAMPSKAGGPHLVAELLKQQGNLAVSEGNYEAAIDCYTRALALQERREL